MVNFEIIDLLGKDDELQVVFKTSVHQKYFNILLLDFLSDSNKKITGSSKPFLSSLRSICKQPSFIEVSSIGSLSIATEKFIHWLKGEAIVANWFPEIDTECDLLLKRKEYLKLCGIISKHNFSRLNHVVSIIQGLFKRNNIEISFDESLLLTENFFERYHSDILNYQGSLLVEFLNNIIWGIYEYMLPVLKRNLIKSDTEPPSYRFKYPNNVSNEFAQNCYWELMKKVQRKPYVRRFKATKYLKMRY